MVFVLLLKKNFLDLVLYLKIYDLICKIFYYTLFGKTPKKQSDMIREYNNMIVDN